MKLKQRPIMRRPFATEKVFAGIGNRDAPEWALKLCSLISDILASNGYILRSGGAPGCDQAFQPRASIHSEIYVPWHGFEGFPMRWPIPDIAYEAAIYYKPSTRYASDGVASMAARNMMQILGPDLKTKADFVVCYTKNGRQENYDGYKDVCGTDSAITCARDNGIPVINICNPGWSEYLSAITGLDFLHLENA